MNKTENIADYINCKKFEEWIECTRSLMAGIAYFKSKVHKDGKAK